MADSKANELYPRCPRCGDTGSYALIRGSRFPYLQTHYCDCANGRVAEFREWCRILENGMP